MIISNVNVTVHNGEIEKQEILNYIEYITTNHPKQILKNLELTIDNDEVEMKYDFDPVKFDRIRRITGYLVGTVDRWNNAKRSEEHDRVKHG